MAFLAIWVSLNAIALTRRAKPFDPFPFIFLNLILSMVAALQAPIILMSQNSQPARDRLAATLDHEINLRAEAEIMALHDKLDAMRIERLEDLLEEMIKRMGDLEQGNQPPTTSPSR